MMMSSSVLNVSSDEVPDSKVGLRRLTDEGYCEQYDHERPPIIITPTESSHGKRSTDENIKVENEVFSKNESQKLSTLYSEIPKSMNHYSALTSRDVTIPVEMSSVLEPVKLRIQGLATDQLALVFDELCTRNKQDLCGAAKHFTSIFADVFTDDQHIMHNFMQFMKELERLHGKLPLDQKSYVGTIGLIVMARCVDNNDMMTAFLILALLKDRNIPLFPALPFPVYPSQIILLVAKIALAKHAPKYIVQILEMANWFEVEEETRNPWSSTCRIDCVRELLVYLLNVNIEQFSDEVQCEITKLIVTCRNKLGTGSGAKTVTGGSKDVFHRTEEEDACRMFVGNLTPSMSNHDVRETLIKTFPEAINVSIPCYPHGTKHRKYCFVQFRSKACVTSAVKKENIYCCGQPLLLEFCVRKGRRYSKDDQSEEGAKRNAEKKFVDECCGNNYEHEHLKNDSEDTAPKKVTEKLAMKPTRESACDKGPGDPPVSGGSKNEFPRRSDGEVLLENNFEHARPEEELAKEATVLGGRAPPICCRSIEASPRRSDGEGLLKQTFEDARPDGKLAKETTLWRDKCTMFVGNLPRYRSARDVKKTLTEIFPQAIGVIIPSNARRRVKMHCFVQFESDSDVASSVEKRVSCWGQRLRLASYDGKLCSYSWDEQSKKTSTRDVKKQIVDELSENVHEHEYLKHSSEKQTVKTPHNNDFEDRPLRKGTNDLTKKVVMKQIKKHTRDEDESLKKSVKKKKVPTATLR